MLLLLFAPWCLAWGVGLEHPILSTLGAPAALLASLPAQAGWAGVAGIAAVAAASRWSTGARRLASTLGKASAFSVVVCAVAATRPLGWLPVAAPLAWWGLTGRRPPRELPALPWVELAPLTWWLLSRMPPFGPGLLGPSLEDTIAAAVVSVPAGWHGAVFAVAVIAAATALRRWSPDPAAGVAGALLAVALQAWFAPLDDPWMGAAVGFVAGAWATRPPGLAALFALCLLLSGLASGLDHRWDCRRGWDSRTTRFLLRDPQLDELAIVPGNLPLLLARSADGSELLRFSTTGAVSDRRPLDPPGGRLASSGGPAPTLVRVLDGPRPRIEWYLATSLELRAARTLEQPCSLGSLSLEEGGRAWLLCGDRLLGVTPEATSVVALPAPAADARWAVDSLVVTGRGLWPRVWVLGPDGERRAQARLPLGAAPPSIGGGRLLIPGGPSGRVTLRGPGPEEAAAGLGRALERTALRWPGELAPAPEHPGFYAVGPLSGRAWLVDLEVPWHRHAEHLGAPPRRVVADPRSGTLYGVNRCGVFELRIRSTFPWSSSGDVEVDVEAPETP